MESSHTDKIRPEAIHPTHDEDEEARGFEVSSKTSFVRLY
jgi:hypothetical protein